MSAQRKVVSLPKSKGLLETHVNELKAAASDLAKAKLRYNEARDKLVPLLGKLPSEGTKRINVGGSVVTVKTHLNRRLNSAKVKKALELLPESVTQRVLPVTHKLSVRELHWLETNDQDSYRAIRAVFTATKGVPSVTVAVTQ